VQVAAGVLESFTLSVAWSEVKREASKERLTPLQYLSRGTDPLNPAVLLEDSVAVVGVVVAGASIGLTAVRVASKPWRLKRAARRWPYSLL
jgi:zinc transporter 9